jgi:DNA-binding transcriptional LysR family regulator
MDAGDLVLLDSIISEGGIAPAARKLGQPKATISRRLRRLEHAIGAPLFERTGKRLRLTRLGEAFATPAESVRIAVAAAQSLSRANASNDHGALRLSSPMLFGHRILAPFLSSFLGRRPGVIATLTLDQSPVDLLRRNLDIAFSVHLPEAPYLVVQKLAEFDLGLFGVPTLAERVRDLRDLHDLPAVNTSNSDTAQMVWRLTSGQTTQEVTARVRATVNDPEAASRFIADGVGIGALPAFVAQDLVASGRIRPILPGMSVGKVSIYAAAPPLRTSIPIVRSFLTGLKARIRKQQADRGL